MVFGVKECNDVITFNTGLKECKIAANMASIWHWNSYILIFIIYKATIVLYLFVIFRDKEYKSIFWFKIDDQRRWWRSIWRKLWIQMIMTRVVWQRMIGHIVDHIVGEIMERIVRQSVGLIVWQIFEIFVRFVGEVVGQMIWHIVRQIEGHIIRAIAESWNRS